MKIITAVFAAYAIWGCGQFSWAIAAESDSAGHTIVRNEQRASVRAPDTVFTGTAYVDRIYATSSDLHSRGSVVTFEPGARSYWHTHFGGQVLFILSGLGKTQVWGEPADDLRPGDVLICPAGVKHWHGAFPDKHVTYIQINDEQEPGRIVEWLEAVSDDQYLDR